MRMHENDTLCGKPRTEGKMTRRQLLGGTLFALGTVDLAFARWEDNRIQQKAAQEVENIEIQTPDTPSVPDTYHEDTKKRLENTIYSSLAEEKHIDKKVMLAGILWTGATIAFTTERVTNWLKHIKEPPTHLYQEHEEMNGVQDH